MSESRVGTNPAEAAQGSERAPQSLKDRVVGLRRRLLPTEEDRRRGLTEITEYESTAPDLGGESRTYNYYKQHLKEGSYNPDFPDFVTAHRVSSVVLSKGDVLRFAGSTRTLNGSKTDLDTDYNVDPEYIKPTPLTAEDITASIDMGEDDMGEDGKTFDINILAGEVKSLREISLLVGYFDRSFKGKEVNLGIVYRTPRADPGLVSVEHEFKGTFEEYSERFGADKSPQTRAA